MTLYANLTNSSIKEYQDFLFTIFLDIIQVCNQHKLDWWLESGTLLGLIRHNDFIPWDDDLDIAMPRKDYEKFLLIAKKQLADKYELITHQQEASFWGKAKVTSAKFIMIEKIRGIHCQKFGAFVDIFPFDPMPYNRFGYKLLKYKHLSNWYVNYSKALSVKSVIKHYIAKSLTYIIPFIEKIAYKIITVDGLALLDSYYSVIHKCNEVYPLQQYDWRGHTVNIPNQAEKYLENLFGKNYMVLPPEEKRRVHGDIIINCTLFKTP